MHKPKLITKYSKYRTILRQNSLFLKHSVNKGCTVRFGKIDTAGQSQSIIFPDNEAAQRHAEKLIAEKLRKGYVECATP